MSAFWIGIAAPVAIVTMLVLTAWWRKLRLYIMVLGVLTVATVSIYYAWPWLATLPVLLKEQRILEGVNVYLVAVIAVSALVLFLLLINKRWVWATFLLAAILFSGTIYWIGETDTEDDTTKIAAVAVPKPQEVRRSDSVCGKPVQFTLQKEGAKGTAIGRANCDFIWERSRNSGVVLVTINGDEKTTRLWEPDNDVWFTTAIKYVEFELRSEAEEPISVTVYFERRRT